MQQYHYVPFMYSFHYREWYGYHFPELVKIVNDNYMYARVVKLIGSRKEFSEDKLPELEEMVMDESKAKAIYDATKVSMGMWRHVQRDTYCSNRECSFSIYYSKLGQIGL